MKYFKARQVEVRERGYTLLEGLADPINPAFLGEA